MRNKAAPFLMFFFFAVAASTAAVSLGLLVQGCTVKIEKPGDTPTAEYWGARHASLVNTNYTVADRMLVSLKERLPRNDPVLVSTFVSIGDLRESSDFGRITSDQIASRLAQKGYKIVELKLRDGSALIKKGEGEFFLSRELKNISIEHNAQAVLVGTYATGKNSIYISVRIIRTSDNALLAAEDYRIGLSPDIKSLLKS